jgi:biopolymer transport protein ExbD
MAADAPRFFNVWLVQPNTVYRGVPYTVVCDWIQEGRLLGRDCIRTPGAPAWEYLDAHPLFNAYFTAEGLPRFEEPAEAIDQINLEFEPVYQRHDEGDEDVDMIPLIDISMVLLVFFMMTAQNLLTATPFKLPAAKNTEMYDDAGNVVVTIRYDPENPKHVVYHFSRNFTNRYTDLEILDMVKEEKQKRGDLRVMMQVEGTLPFDQVQPMLISLQKLGFKKIPLKVDRKPGEGGG